MSNYLLVITDPEKSDHLGRWLGRASPNPDTEISILKIGAGAVLTYVSKNSQADLLLNDRLLFKGFAIDYARKSLVFGANGYKTFVENSAPPPLSTSAVEGSYIAMEWNGRQATVSNDLFAMSPMLYFADEGIVAVSDSAFVLSQLRKELGLITTLDEESVIARSWLNAMAGQLLSEDTLLEQIKYAAVGTTLVIRTEGGIALEVRKRPLREVFLVPDGSYEQIIRRSAQKMASLIHTLSSIAMNSARLSISGGMDSRACLAAALISPIARSQAAFNCTNTNSSHTTDFKIVEELSKILGFPLGARPTDKTRRHLTQRIEHPLGLWFLANAGIYDFLVMPQRTTKDVASFIIGGHGAELHKGNYGWRSVGLIAKAITEGVVSDAFKRQTEKALTSCGIEALDQSGSEWHYLAYRNALHSGRFVMTTMIGLRPYMMRELVGLSRSPLNQFPRPKHGAPSMVNDLLISIHPDLAKQPFDVPEKNMSADYVDMRTRTLGGGLHAEELDLYQIYGDFQSVPNGHPSAFMEIAKQEGMCLPPTRETVVSLVQRGFSKIDSPLIRMIYEPVLEDALHRLADPGLQLSQTRAAPGKLMAFNLLSD